MAESKILIWQVLAAVYEALWFLGDALDYRAGSPQERDDVPLVDSSET